MQTNVEQTLKQDKKNISEPEYLRALALYFISYPFFYKCGTPRTCLEKIELNPRNQLLFELLFVMFILVVLQSEGINLNFKPTSLIKVAFQKPAGILEGYSSKAGIFHHENGFFKIISKVL